MHEIGAAVAPSESLVEQYVKGCGREPFFTAYDVAYLHQMVIDDVGEVVGREVVGTFVKHLVIKDA